MLKKRKQGEEIYQLQKKLHWFSLKNHKNKGNSIQKNNNNNKLINQIIKIIIINSSNSSSQGIR